MSAYMQKIRVFRGCNIYKSAGTHPHSVTRSIVVYFPGVVTPKRYRYVTASVTSMHKALEKAREAIIKHTKEHEQSSTD